MGVLRCDGDSNYPRSRAHEAKPPKKSCYPCLLANHSAAECNDSINFFRSVAASSSRNRQRGFR